MLTPAPSLFPKSPPFHLSKFAIQNESLKTDRQITEKHVLSLDFDVILQDFYHNRNDGTITVTSSLTTPFSFSTTTMATCSI